MPYPIRLKCLSKATRGTIIKSGTNFLTKDSDKRCSPVTLIFLTIISFAWDEEIFNKWDKLYFSEVAPTSESELKIQKEIRDPIGKKLNDLGFQTNLFDMSSPWVGMNLLSVDQETVIVDERQKEFIKFLEKNKLKVVPVRMRHIYTQGGGIHCATLDTVRDSKFEDYFI